MGDAVDNELHRHGLQDKLHTPFQNVQAGIAHAEKETAADSYHGKPGGNDPGHCFQQLPVEENTADWSLSISISPTIRPSRAIGTTISDRVSRVQAR